MVKSAVPRRVARALRARGPFLAPHKADVSDHVLHPTPARPHVFLCPWLSLFWAFPITWIIQHVAFCVQLLSAAGCFKVRGAVARVGALLSSLLVLRHGCHDKDGPLFPIDLSPDGRQAVSTFGLLCGQERSYSGVCLGSCSQPLRGVETPGV